MPRDDDAAWAEVDALIRDFRGQFEFTRSEYPDGVMFVAKPLPMTWTPVTRWIVRPTAQEVRDEIAARQAE
jgi:hypothetical protein